MLRPGDRPRSILGHLEPRYGLPVSFHGGVVPGRELLERQRQPLREGIISPAMRPFEHGVPVIKELVPIPVRHGERERLNVPSGPLGIIEAASPVRLWQEYQVGDVIHGRVEGSTPFLHVKVERAGVQE